MEQKVDVTFASCRSALLFSAITRVTNAAIPPEEDQGELSNKFRFQARETTPAHADTLSGERTNASGR